MQVKGGQADPAVWLDRAAAALSGLHYLADSSCRQAVVRLINAILETPMLCDELSGCFNKTAALLTSLMTFHLPSVQAAAYQALAGTACIGPPASRLKVHALLCQSLLLETLVTKGLVDSNNKPFAAELLQALIVGGELDRGCACLLPWAVWIACYEHDHAVGGIAAGINQYLQEWR